LFNHFGMKFSKIRLSFLIIFLILLIDQVLKFWIKTHFMLGQEIHIIGNWFIIHFVENNGMAFGFEFAGEYGKMFLSVFRILAVAVMIWYLFRITRKDAPLGFVVSLSLIIAGAFGNIIDSAFYGLLFDHSYGQVASFLPANGGYSGFLHGKVVDMLYFPLINTRYPEWVPIWGGEDFIFFRPVFNIADSSITTGILMVLIFYRKFFSETTEKPKAEPAEETLPENPQ
jgi:signal peptidase II